MRSSLNLLGTTLDVETGEWIEHSSGIGAGMQLTLLCYPLGARFCIMKFTRFQ
jgi:hypothetical protein